MDIAERNELNVESRWRKIQKAEKQHIERNVNKNAHLKARIFGYLAGDGNIYVGRTKSNKHHSARFFPDHHSLLEPFCKAFEIVYGKAPLVYKLPNFYCVTIDSKVIIQDIIKQADFGVTRWRVPFNILVNRIAKKEWLRAFFDCEAYVCRNHIKIQTVNKAGMLEVKSLLEEFDIPSRYYVYTPKNEKWKVNHMLFLVKEARKNYLDNIGFNHSIKQSKLKKSQNF